MGLPCSQLEVARLSIWNWSVKDFMTNSAMGLRQIFPKQTKAIFFMGHLLLLSPPIIPQLAKDFNPKKRKM
jgi:hypothetical protein